jgi:hypothetical protein
MKYCKLLLDAVTVLRASDASTKASGRLEEIIHQRVKQLFQSENAVYISK